MARSAKATCLSCGILLLSSQSTLLLGLVDWEDWLPQLFQSQDLMPMHPSIWLGIHWYMPLYPSVYASVFLVICLYIPCFRPLYTLVYAFVCLPKIVFCQTCMHT